MRWKAETKGTVIVLPKDEFERIKGELKLLDAELLRLLAPLSITMKQIGGHLSSKPSASNAARRDSSEG